MRPYPIGLPIRDASDFALEEGHAIVRACVRRNQPGPFQLQAAIQAVHCNADGAVHLLRNPEGAL